MKIENFIQDQPQVFNQIMASNISAIKEKFQTKIIRRIYFIGAGSSMNAILTVCDIFDDEKISVSTYTPRRFCDNFSHFAPFSSDQLQGTLVIVVSQSGASLDTNDAARLARQLGFEVVALTGDNQSTLAKIIDDPIIMPVEDERVGPKTKGYSATALILRLIACLLAKKDEALTFDLDFSQSYQNLITQAQAWSHAQSEALKNVDFIAIIGQGQQFGTALEASLKIAEMSGIPTIGLETGEATHGRLHGFTQNSMSFLLADNPAQLKWVEQIQKAMDACQLPSQICYLGDPNDISASTTRTLCDLMWPAHNKNGLDLRTLSAIIPFQWLGVDLANKKGHSPEAMRYPQLGPLIAGKESANNE